ncbi:fimbrial protein [Enterobacter asburiae]|uniref:fimbrial protein n=1 Tax=Enterobacter asburiae TaxID=61645 RepID=UPI00287AF4BD|nr:fimbrial protein [Enterobacter asburiae]MDS1916219.1 fimbrial protein [Enterobacter asburiae]
MNISKKTIVRSIAGVFFCLLGSNVHAATTVAGGTVNFNGSVVTAACAVKGTSTNQTVQLDQVRSAKLNQVGSSVDNQPFRIELIDCDKTVATSVQAYFTGTEASTGGLLSTTNPTIGIQILDQTNKALALNDDVNGLSTATNLVDTDTILSFKTKIVAVANPVTASSFNATAYFNLVYP